MKKFLFLSLMTLFVISCGNNSGDSKQPLLLLISQNLPMQILLMTSKEGKVNFQKWM